MNQSSSDSSSRDQTLDERIYRACRDGLFAKLRSILYSNKNLSVNRLLKPMESGVPQRYLITPLIVASRYGRNNIVKLLLRKQHNCAVDQVVQYVAMGDHSFNANVTALWIAVKASHLDVVRTLVSIGHANVNYYPQHPHSTPLFEACDAGYLDIVRYLLENGSDINAVNVKGTRKGMTCLMTAAQQGHCDVAQYLLFVEGKNKHPAAFVNKVDPNGAAAIFYAADKGYLEVMKLLLDNGALMVIDSVSWFTAPLVIASHRHHGHIVDYFLLNETSKYLTLSQRIETLEFLALSYLPNCEYDSRNMNDNLHKFYHYFRCSMKLRYSENLEKPLLKENSVSPPNAAYEYRTECQTVEDLEALERDFISLMIEGLMIAERRALSVGSQYLGALYHLADLYSTQKQFECFFQVWIYAYRLAIKSNVFIDCDQLAFCLIELQDKQIISVDFYLEILSLSMELLQQNKPTEKWPGNYHWEDDEERVCRRPWYRYDYDLKNTVFWLYIACQILPAKPRKDQQRNYQHVRKLVHHDFRSTVGDVHQSLLHLTLREVRISDERSGAIFNKHPIYFEIIKLLIACGAEINAIDNCGDTPLHYLCAYNWQNRLDGHCTIEEFFETFTSSGAHIDATNLAGKSVTDCKRNEHIRDLFQKHSSAHLSLQCSCARLIKQAKLNYYGHVSKSLYAFIELHNPSFQNLHLPSEQCYSNYQRLSSTDSDENYWARLTTLFE